MHILSPHSSQCCLPLSALWRMNGLVSGAILCPSRRGGVCATSYWSSKWAANGAGGPRLLGWQRLALGRPAGPYGSNTNERNKANNVKHGVHPWLSTGDIQSIYLTPFSVSSCRVPQATYPVVRSLFISLWLLDFHHLDSIFFPFSVKPMLSSFTRQVRCL